MPVRWCTVVDPGFEYRGAGYGESEGAWYIILCVMYWWVRHINKCLGERLRAGRGGGGGGGGRGGGRGGREAGGRWASFLDPPLKARCRASVLCRLCRLHLCFALQIDLGYKYWLGRVIIIYYYYIFISGRNRPKLNYPLGFPVHVAFVPTRITKHRLMNILDLTITYNIYI